MPTLDDDDGALATKRIQAWYAALRKVTRGSPELVDAGLARWRWYVGHEVVMTTLVEPGAHAGAGLAVEIVDADPIWKGLVLLPRAQVPDRIADDANGLTALLVTGDAAFDDAVAVLSSEVAAYGLFDPKLRGLTRSVIDDGAVVLGGVLKVSASARPLSTPALLANLLALREALTTTTVEAEQQAVAIAQHDPVAAVRARYTALARAAPFLRHAIERDIREGDIRGDALEALSEHVADETQSPTLRRVALQRLLSRYPLATLAELPGVPWRDFEMDDELILSFAAALRGDRRDPTVRPADHVEAALTIARALFGDLAWSHPLIAEPLLRLLPLADSEDGRRPLIELGRHHAVTIATAARVRFLASFENWAALAAAVEGKLFAEVMTAPELAQAILERAGKVLEQTDATTADAISARRIARRLWERLSGPAQGETPAFINGDDSPLVTSRSIRERQEWPDAELALPFIASHHAARDPAGLPFMAALLAHQDADVQRTALLALLDLPATELGRRALAVYVLPSDLLAAAVDASRPRHALDYVLAALPEGQGKWGVDQFLSVLAQIGTIEQMPFVTRILDNGDKATVVAALKTLGAIGDASVVHKIEAHASGFFRDSDIKAAARAALAAIAERGAPRGSLSLAEGGGLTLSDEENE